MNYIGILIGLSSFLIIGLFHPIVIKGEYYFSKNIWPVFLICGLALVIGSIFIENYVTSTLLCVLGFSCFWSIKELFEQENRVKKGWFPSNPKKQGKTQTSPTVFETINALYMEREMLQDYAFKIVRIAICFSGLLSFILISIFVPSIRTVPFVIVMCIHIVFFMIGIVRNLLAIISFFQYPYGIIVDNENLFIRHNLKYIQIKFCDLRMVNCVESGERIDNNSGKADSLLIADSELILFCDGKKLRKKTRNPDRLTKAVFSALQS